MSEEKIEEQISSLEEAAKGLTAEVAGLKETDTADFDAKFKDMTDKIEANQKAMAEYQEEKLKADQMKKVELLEAQMKSMNEKVEAPRRPRIEVPTNGERYGNMTVAQKGWESLLKGHTTLRDGVAELTPLGKDLNTSESTVGTEWVTTGVVPGLIDLVRLGGKVAPACKQVVLGNKNDDVLVQTGDATLLVQSEQTTDNGTVLTAGQLATTKKTLTSSRIGAVTWISDQLEEDSVIDVINATQGSIARSFALGLDDAIINGDTTATHQDSDITAAADIRKAFLGLRKLGLGGTTLSAAISSATPTMNNAQTVLNLLGSYGAESVAWVVGPKGRNDLIAASWATTNSNSMAHLTVDGAGNLRLFGFPVIVSEKARENLNASGVYDGTTTSKRQLIAFRTDRWLVGIRKNISVELDRRPIQAQTAVVGSMRFAFGAAVTPSTASEPSVGVGYNIG